MVVVQIYILAFPINSFKTVFLLSGIETSFEVEISLVNVTH